MSVAIKSGEYDVCGCWVRIGPARSKPSARLTIAVFPVAETYSVDLNNSEQAVYVFAHPLDALAMRAARLAGTRKV